MRFLDVKTDYAFKKVFGSDQSKDVLLSFLNAILQLPGGRVLTDLQIVDPYQIPLLKGMKDTFVDVRALISDGSTVIVEMQVLNYEGFEKCVFRARRPVIPTMSAGGRSEATLVLKS